VARGGRPVDRVDAGAPPRLARGAPDGDAPARTLLDVEAADPEAAAGWRGEGRLGTPRRWRCDAFAGTLESHARRQWPRLIGMRLSWHPSTSWSVGLSRTLQWGGVSGDESPRSLLRALLGRDNRGSDGITERNEPCNQLAGVGVCYERPLGSARLAAYGQLVAEDAAALHRGRAQARSQLYEPGDALRGTEVALGYPAAPDLTLGAALQYWSAGERGADSARLWVELRAW
jgi:hypothetical protein